MATTSLRLVVCFDGTDNTPKDRTNVWRAHELLAPRGADGVEQRRKYIQGVGTEFGSLLSGSIFGVGVAKKIQEGYRWLVENWQAGAEIYVFGFSRGAFTARSLVQMVACCGLVRPQSLAAWNEERVFDRYESISKQEKEEVRPIYRLRFWAKNPAQAPPNWKPTADESFFLDDAKVAVVKIKMAGLWDTVGALGLDSVQNQGAKTQKSAAHNVRPTSAQEHGYHAIAIDEHRPMFDVTLWRTFVETGASRSTVMADYANRYEQRWFIGAHSDVGGGYGEDSLPDLSLKWMLGKASALGLTFTHSVEPVGGACHAQIHDSFKAFAGGVLSIWDEWLDGNQRHFRTIGKPPRAITTATGKQGELWSINEQIDESVIKRFIEDPTYRPPSLVAWLRGNATQVPQGISLSQRTQRIYARNYWNETGVYVRKDLQYRVRLVQGIGEPLRDDKRLAGSINGEDWTGFTYKTAELLHGKRNTKAKWFALVGTVDKEHAWPITDGDVFTPKVSGQLVCYFNDIQVELEYRDNSGWVVLEIDEVK
jgi:uncharacterized protein (DUF2235 family)